MDELGKKMEHIKHFYEDGNIRIYPKRQNELWDEGYDEEEKQYVGSNWTKCVRALSVLFVVL